MWKKYPFFTTALVLTFLFAFGILVGMAAWVVGAEWGFRLFIGSIITGAFTSFLSFVFAKMDI